MTLLKLPRVTIMETSGIVTIHDAHNATPFCILLI